jgi:twitching motility protein PilU
MQTFDQALYELTKANLISEMDALRYADSANDLKLRFKGLA